MVNANWSAVSGIPADREEVAVQARALGCGKANVLILVAAASAACARTPEARPAAGHAGAVGTPATVMKIDNSAVTGTGYGEFVFVGCFHYDNDCKACGGKTQHYTYEVGSYVLVRFNGTRIKIHSFLNPDH